MKYAVIYARYSSDDDYIRIFLKYVQGRGSGTKEVADIEKYFDEEYKTPESMSDIIPVEHRFINDPTRRTIFFMPVVSVVP